MQACSSEGETGRLPRVMAAFARPTRIVRGKEVDAGWTVDESRFFGAIVALSCNPLCLMCEVLEAMLSQCFSCL